MTRVGLAAALVAAAALAAVLGVRALAPAAGPAGPALPGGQAVAVSAALVPAVHLFAEPVVARLQVSVDRRRVDPEAVRAEWSFEPYEELGPRRLGRTDAGDVTHLTFSVSLRCLGPPCVPPVLPSDAGERETGRGERHAFAFPPARVTVGGDVDARTARWPTLEVVSRVNASEHQGLETEAPPPGAPVAFPFAYGLAPAPATYLLPPRLLAGAALAAALLLLLVPGREVLRAVRRRRRTPAEAWALLTPHERARLVAAWAAGRDDPAERRRALELAAGELGAGGDDVLASRVRALAWAGGGPEPGAATALAEELAQRGNGRAR